MSSANVTSDDVAPKFYDSISDRYDKYYSQDQGLLAFIDQSLELLPPNASVRYGFFIVYTLLSPNSQTRSIRRREICSCLLSQRSQITTSLPQNSQADTHNQVLDIGSGTGIPTSLAVVNSGRKLHGIDIAPSMIQLSRKNVPGGTFEQVSMLDYTPKDGQKFDGAFVVLSMFHMKRDEMIKAIGKWKDWVKGNGEGYLFICTYLAEDAAGIKEDMFSKDGVNVFRLFFHSVA